MVAPTPTKTVYKNGDLIIVNWHAAWTTTDNLSDSVVVDISSDGPQGATELEVLKLYAEMSSGIRFDLEFDAATDDLIVKSALGATYMERDFRLGDKYLSLLRDPKSSGTTGDIVLTTESAALADEIALTIICRAR